MTDLPLPEPRQAWLPTHTLDYYTEADLIAYAAAKTAALEADLAQCYRLTGADPDGDEDWRLARNAVQEVRRMRAENDALEAECARLRADEKRLDWLADPKNTIGNVTLPTECVTENIHSLRAAIDAAMAIDAAIAARSEG